MTEDKKEIVPLEIVEKLPVKQSPIEMASQLISQQVDPAFVEKMLDLQIKFEENEAKKAYVKAMTEFKKSDIVIFKDKKVEYNETKYNHASLYNVTDTLNKELSKHNLFASWVQTQDDKGSLTVTCKLTHSLGHSESTSLTAPPDKSGGKNNIQAIGSTNSYLERYTLLAITGQSTHDMDDDGQSSEIEYLSVDQQTEIGDMVLAINRTVDDFCNHMKVKSLDMIPLSKYEQCKINLKPVGK